MKRCMDSQTRFGEPVFRCPVTSPRDTARLSREQYRQFLGIANGSNLELQTQREIARELGFGNAQEADRIEKMSIEVGKMLTAMIRKL